MEENDGNILLKPVADLIEELAGSIEIPEHLKGVDIDEAIRIAKKKYFGREAK